MRVKMNRAAIRTLLRSPELIENRAKANENACNAESSWGGYHSDSTVTGIRARATVWVEPTGDAEADERRAQRLIRNLGAGG